jgi:hypothetical protein
MYKVKLTKTKIFLLGIFILGIVNTPNISFAESQIEVQDEEINVETSPSNPEPYTEVTITLSSYATDLTKAIINWNGQKGLLSSGIGKTSYTFTTGGPDTTDYFTVEITPTESMGTITKNISITPSEIEVMWESVDGYVPPFYRGKSLPVSGGLIKAVAIPNTSTIKSGNGSLTYTWGNDGNAVTEASGYNKNSYTFRNSMFDKVNEITVAASSVDENYSAEKTIDIPVYEPKIILYKKSPTEGIFYNVALGKEAAMDQTDNEMTIAAEPYFFSISSDKISDLNYSWKINGSTIPTPSKKAELTVRPETRGGYATIGITIENIGEIFQKISKELKLNI